MSHPLDLAEGLSYLIISFEFCANFFSFSLYNEPMAHLVSYHLLHALNGSLVNTIEIFLLSSRHVKVTRRYGGRKFMHTLS